MAAILAHVSVALALVTGTAAGVLSLLSWEIFRHSPFGRAVAVLSVFMSIYIIYHGVVLVLHPEPLIAKLLENAAYTGLVVFIAMMIRVQRRFRRQATRGDT